MNLIVLQAAGPADANIAAAALNANRQIGSLLGVALASVILHALRDANLATASGFAVIAAAYAGGLVLVMKALRPK
jgi:DHA2 family methylenomycin A resistance protein-like MFS transporter